MSIAIDRLKTPYELTSCEAIQREIIGDGVTMSVSALTAVNRSGGLILAGKDAEAQQPCGTIVDVTCNEEGVASWFTAFYGVKEAFRNQGVGTELRIEEREIGLRQGITRIMWAIDPLRSLDAHLAFNKLGAIAVGYERDLYGELDDPINRGLATDRLIIEWWLTSPRVLAVVDHRALPYHFHLGLDRMEVVTRTTAADNGERRLSGFNDEARGEVILVEIPAKLDRLRARDPDLARDWRLKTRDVFEHLFEAGHVITGFVHEGGRSFHLLERARKAKILEREAGSD